MSAPITVQAQVLGVEQVKARLMNASTWARQATAQEVHALGLELLRKVKEDKLRGGVLNVRTNRLRGSINERFTETDTSVTSQVGTNVVYGRFWELGFNGPMQVKAHTRTITQAFGKPIAPTEVQVGAFTRNVNIQPRPFLRPTLAEMREEVNRRLKAVMVRI